MIKHGELKECNEALVYSGRQKSLSTNCIKHYINKTNDSPLCKGYVMKWEKQLVMWLMNIPNWFSKVYPLVVSGNKKGLINKGFDNLVFILY